jgi:hypothetical protein
MSIFKLDAELKELLRVPWQRIFIRSKGFNIPLVRSLDIKP